MQGQDETTGQAALEQRIRERAYELWLEAGQPHDQDTEFWHRARREIRVEERTYDGALEDTFPASDPPANSGITGP